MSRRTGKFKDYLIEFFIVLLGITIAFWLSNLGEKKKEKELEALYLEDIRSDLKEDQEDLAYCIEENKQKLITLSKAITYYQGENNGTNLDSLVKYAGLIGNYFHFNPNDYTYISLQQSGDFKILTSRELKSSLIELYKLYDFIEREQVNVLDALDGNYFPVLMRNLDMVTGQVVNPGYFTSTEFKNNMGFVINEVSTLIRMYNTANDKINSLLEDQLTPR